ncbi:MAG: hypothetical protein Q8N02_00345 [Methylotenera sp.]|nr:hypothetical protein [Methylotenera sp.]MDP3094018.1 hypothetical protein [Methylotenera sp.]
MSAATDKLFAKKAAKFEAKGELGIWDPIAIGPKNKILYILALIILLMGFSLFVFGEMKDAIALKFIGIIIMMPGAWVGHISRAAKRFYDLVDTYRSALIERGTRSLSDFTALTESSSDEIIAELKELQDAGFFRQFTVDRKNKKFVENADWLEDQSNLRKATFTCPSCGANNTIYVKGDTNVGTCEYCGSSANL